MKEGEDMNNLTEEQLIEEMKSHSLSALRISRNVRFGNQFEGTHKDAEKENLQVQALRSHYTDRFGELNVERIADEVLAVFSATEPGRQN